MERTTRTLYCGYIISCALLTCLLNIPFPSQWPEDRCSMRRVNASRHFHFFAMSVLGAVLLVLYCVFYR